jgi:Rrf2 family protein
MFSSKTYLALLVVLELSQRERSAPLTSRHLARQYNVSKRYLEVVFNNLAKAGIISSKRGIGGGYFLASDIDKLNIYDLSMAAEGGIKIYSGGEYLDEEGDRAGLIRDINRFWNDLNEEMMEKLKSHKISDLVSRLADLKEMYYI